MLHNFFALACFNHDSCNTLSKPESDLFSLKGVIEDISKCINKIIRSVFKTLFIFLYTPNNLIQYD